MLSIEIASKLDSITEVETLIDNVCEELKLNEDHYGNILIAVTEAVNNAIIHGNKYSDSKKVKVDVIKSDDKVYFTVMIREMGLILIIYQIQRHLKILKSPTGGESF